MNDLERKAEINQVKNKIQKGSYNFESSSCPICFRDYGIQLAKKDRYGLPYDLILCKCGLSYQKKRLNKESLFDFYKNHYYKIYALNSIENYHKQEFEQGKVIWNFIKEFTKNRELKILEVGSGASGILKFFKNKGFNKIIGLELDPNYVNYSINIGIDTIQGDISTLVDNKFDLIIYNHVFEHLNDLNNELLMVQDKLSKNGLLYIEVPSIHKLKDYYYNVKKFYQNAHTYNFSEKTLENLLIKNSFKALKIDDFVRGIFVKGDTNSITIKNYQGSVLKGLIQNRIKYYFLGIPKKYIDWSILGLKKILKKLGIFETIKKYYNSFK